jgi:hypothetical protein
MIEIFTQNFPRYRMSWHWGEFFALSLIFGISKRRSLGNFSLFQQTACYSSSFFLNKPKNLHTKKNDQATEKHFDYFQSKNSLKLTMFWWKFFLLLFARNCEYSFSFVIFLLSCFFLLFFIYIVISPPIFAMCLCFLDQQKRKENKKKSLGFFSNSRSLALICAWKSTVSEQNQLLFDVSVERQRRLVMDRNWWKNDRYWLSVRYRWLVRGILNWALSAPFFW